MVDCQSGNDGALLAERLKSLKGHVPIMLLSAYGSPAAIKMRSVDRFFSKSQPPEMLLEALHRLSPAASNLSSTAGSISGKYEIMRRNYEISGASPSTCLLA